MPKELADLDLQGVSIVAPISGLVDRILVQPGERVLMGQTQMTAIIASDPILVDFQVGERNYLVIQKWLRSKPNLTHLPVYVGLVDEAGYPHPGRVLFRTARFDPNTSSCLLHAELPNADGALIPGLSARVQIEYGAPRRAILVPQSALIGDKAIAIVDDQGIARYQRVGTGLGYGDFVEIKSSRSTDPEIDPKARIVLDGVDKIRYDEKVADPIASPPK